MIKVGDRVRLESYPHTWSNVDKALVPIGTLGVVVDVGEYHSGPIWEYTVKFPRKTTWILSTRLSRVESKRYTFTVRRKVNFNE